MRPNSRKLISEINVVPYVDVMLVLLVIFMITAPLMSQGIIVNLPDVPSDPVNAALDDPLILSVDAQGRFYLNFGGDPELHKAGAKQAILVTESSETER